MSDLAGEEDKLNPSSNCSSSSNNFYQFSSTEEEDEEEDQLEVLRKICESDKFNIDVEPGDKDRSRGNRKKRSSTNSKWRRSKYVIYTKWHCEPEEESLQIQKDKDWALGEGTDNSWPDPSSEDPQIQQFFEDWKKYWAENGEEIVWKRWQEKYKEYINSDYDLVDQIKNTSVCSSSSSEGEGERGASAGLKMERERRKRSNDAGLVNSNGGKRSGNGSGSKDADEDPSWEETWQNHCQEEYSEEYKKYVEKQLRMKGKMPDGKDFHPGIRKYYAQRYLLFSKFDEGIKLDYESWFSVTPEQIARHIAEKFKEVGCDGVILDAFCGCGGNAIQFAKLCKKVIAIDIDPVKIENCRHNARIYGMEDKIEFIVGDFMEIGPTLEADAVFLSPPWGGPSYQCSDVFDVKTMIPMDGYKLMDVTKQISPNIGYFLPRNVNKDQLMELAGDKNLVEIERNFHNERVKTIVAYYGQLVRQTIKKVVKH